MSLALAGSIDPEAPVVLVHYGSPHTGRHLAPIVAAAAANGLRVVAFPRPGYGSATRVPGRDVATSARLAVSTLDRIGIGRFSTIGYSGGGPHALATAALFPERVDRVAVFASPAPYDGSSAWFDGIRDRRGLATALRGREDREQHERLGAFDAESFTASDHVLLESRWSSLGDDAKAASGALGVVDDDVAFVRPWGVDLAEVVADTRILQGSDDRVVPPHHSNRLAAAVPGVAVRGVPGAGHIGVLEELPDTLAWIAGG